MYRFIIQEAKPSDVASIEHFLKKEDMVTAGLLAPNSRYWVAQDSSGHILGVIGVELGGNGSALLRSALVTERFRKYGLGKALVKQAVDMCRATGHRVIYCFSTEAGEYWQRQGFREVPVDELVTALPAAPQVRTFDQLGWLHSEVAWRKDV